MQEKVMIGDYLGTIEEFNPGKGTFAEDGKIYAAKIGVKSVDTQKHIAQVLGKDLPTLEVGQTVFGEVMMLKSNNTIVVVSKIQGQKGFIDERSMIYVSNIAQSYVEKPEEMFAVGDVVKAKVVRMENNLIDLSTKEDDLGVVKAFCRKCREPMVLSDKGKDKLKCPGCNRIEKRKVSSDYGNVSEF